MCLRSLFKYYYVIVLHAKQSFTFKTICQRRLEHTWLHKPVDIGYLKQICNFKAVWHFFCIFWVASPWWPSDSHHHNIYLWELRLLMVQRYRNDTSNPLASIVHWYSTSSKNPVVFWGIQSEVHSATDQSMQTRNLAPFFSWTFNKRVFRSELVPQFLKLATGQWS